MLQSLGIVDVFYAAKTKVMVTNGYDDIRVNVRVCNETLERAGKYKHPGCLGTYDGWCVEDIMARIAIVKKGIHKN